MKRFLVVADPIGSPQHVIARAAALAERVGARLDVLGFVFEHVGNLPLRLDDASQRKLKDGLVATHRRRIEEKLRDNGKDIAGDVEVYWDKRLADRVIRRDRAQRYDLIVKSAHRSETFLYTSADWQLLRGCRASVLLVAEKRWSGGKHVLAAVDLATKVRSKLALNYEIVEEAAALAKALDRQLHIGYVVPFSKVLRDLDVLNKAELKREGMRLAQAFRQSLAGRGVAVDGIHVATGAPETALVDLAAKNGIGLVVLGCVGRTKLAGRVIGNTAEQILRLIKADVLAVKPGTRSAAGLAVTAGRRRRSP